MGNSHRFWDRIAERYARKPVPDEDVYQEKLALTREYLRDDMTVMEFGCGTGSTAIAHAPFVKHILATDLSAKMIAIARAKAEQARIENVTFRQSAFEEFDAEDQAFDVVMGHSILHLVSDRDATIASVHGLLKPGGVFVSSTACIADSMKYFRLIAPIGRALGLIPLVRVFTAEQLVESLKRAGFRIDRQWRPDKAMAVFIVATKPA